MIREYLLTFLITLGLLLVIDRLPGWAQVAAFFAAALGAVALAAREVRRGDC